MPATTELDHRYQSAKATLAQRGQEHVLRWWEGLAPNDRDSLLTDVESIPWDILGSLIHTHVLATPTRNIPQDLRPAEVHPAEPQAKFTKKYDDARKLGRQLLTEGRVAAFTVAGGQGTRLGVDGPKGEVEVTPAGGRTLFQIFGETVLAARRRYGCAIPWYVMTSPANHDATVACFARNGYFGLPPEDVVLFPQGMLPALDFDGKLLLSDKHRIAMAPDGHGGSLKALAKNRALADMCKRGIEIISYFQVDNPLAKPFDPLFLGLHAATGSEMSTKVTRKADDLERVGNVCVQDGRVVVIEYSDFPDVYAHATHADGSRKFDAGNIAIHLLDVAFVDGLVGQSLQLPFRRAEKKVAFVDASGERVEPKSPNAVKLEMFVFDAIGLARNPLLLEVDRAEEFSPVKNATGVDSLETAKRDQTSRACRWLEAAGVSVPRKPDGQPDLTITIAPSFALEAADVAENIDRVPKLKPRDTVVLT